MQHSCCWAKPGPIWKRCNEETDNTGTLCICTLIHQVSYWVQDLVEATGFEPNHGIIERGEVDLTSSSREALRNIHNVKDCKYSKKDIGNANKRIDLPVKSCKGDIAGLFGKHQCLTVYRCIKNRFQGAPMSSEQCLWRSTSVCISIYKKCPRTWQCTLPTIALNLAVYSRRPDINIDKRLSLRHLPRSRIVNRAELI